MRKLTIILSMVTAAACGSDAVRRIDAANSTTGTGGQVGEGGAAGGTVGTAQGGETGSDAATSTGGSLGGDGPLGTGGGHSDGAPATGGARGDSAMATGGINIPDAPTAMGGAFVTDGSAGTGGTTAPDAFASTGGSGPGTGGTSRGTGGQGGGSGGAGPGSGGATAASCVPQSSVEGSRTDSPPVDGDPQAVCVKPSPPATCAPLPSDTPSWACKPTVLATDHEVILWGQGSPKGYCDPAVLAGSVYDVTSNTWTAIATNGAPASFADTLPFVVGRRLVIIGFTFAEGQFFGRYIYDLDAHAWTLSAPTSKNPVLSREGNVVVGSRILFAQKALPGFTVEQNYLHLYDPDTDQWIEVAPFPLSERTWAPAVVANGKWVVWGGQSIDGTSAFADGAVFDSAANKWTTMPTAGAPPVNTSIKAVADPATTRAFFFGGRSSGQDITTPERVDGAFFDVAAGTWTTIPAPPTPQTTYEQLWHLGAFGNRLVVPRAGSGIVSVFDASSRQWTDFAETACAVSNGSTDITPYAIYKNKLLLAGSNPGSNVGTAVAGISLYDLASGAVASLDGEVTPVARTGAVLIWAGTHLAVLGGYHYQQTCYTPPSPCMSKGGPLEGGFTLTW